MFNFAHNLMNYFLHSQTVSDVHRPLSVLAQTALFFAASVETAYCASVRGKKVTLRMGRKGEMHEETCDHCGNTQHDKRLLGGKRKRSNS
jgi:hypothetical protein